MAFAYTVRASLPSQQSRDEYLDWLRAGHVHAVLDAGASAARIILDDARPLEIVTQYEFTDREAFRIYERDRAPALRAEGAARFGSRASFARSTGECLVAQPRGDWES